MKYLALEGKTPTDYNIKAKHSFIDIGSGFGKPVFHSAMYFGKKVKSC